MRQKYIVANWKMYKTIHEGVDFIHELLPKISNPPSHVYLAVPFTMINACASAVRGTSVEIGAQNMHDASEGAYTGEIAGRMLKEAGAHFVVLGHSERRKIFKEEDAFINRKVKRALEVKLRPLLCIGETLEERESGKMEGVLHHQLEEGLQGLSAEQLEPLIIAYEPVWAIGTGKIATPQQAQETQLQCRKFIENKWGAPFAERVPILYGGSVKPENSNDLLKQPDIDGFLIGGASLSVESFSQIINNYRGIAT